jgi:hypothetical protein
MLVGLGLVAGAVLLPLGGQDTTRVRRDTVAKVPVPARADSLIKKDSLAPPKLDTLRAALTQSECASTPDIAAVRSWDRAQLSATGALTVADLVARLPGATTLQTGWISAPAAAAYLGDVRRVRVFYDGVALDALDPRTRGILDLTQINLWSAESACIEQTASEVRVHLRSWRVVSTTPSTRTDVGTGDQQTNLYRGFYGRRFDHGEAIQFGAQQFGTTPPSSFGTSSDQLGLVARLGWAGERWSVDAFATQVSRHRGVIVGETRDSILAVESTRRDAYVRVGLGNPDTSARWVQALAVASKYEYTGILNDTAARRLAADQQPSVDTSKFRSQYVLSGGLAGYGGRVSVTERLRAGSGARLRTPSVRASYWHPLVSVNAFVEAKSVDSVGVADVSARFTPLSRVNVFASAGRTTDVRAKDTTQTVTYLRVEGGVRVRDVWLLGGMMRRDSTRLTPPRLFDSTFAFRGEPTATGATIAVRGRLWRAVNANAWAVRWSDSSGFYRPRYQTRTELFVATNLIKRFPTNNFGFLGSLTHEYRSGARFPVGTAAVDRAPGYRTISSLIEIRVLDAVVSWQFRNFLGERYSQVPGFIMPRQTNFYGVRWQFWG